MLLLKVKLTPKFKSKLYNYNKILKYINVKSKLLFLSLLYYHVYKNTTHDKCHYVFMYHERDKNTTSQTNSSIKYISNTHGGVIQNEIY